MQENSAYVVNYKLALAICFYRDFPDGSVVRNPLVVQEPWVPSLGKEDPLEKGKATHLHILSWETPRTEEPGRLQSMGSRESDTSGRQHTPTSRRVKSYAFAAAAFHSPWKTFVSEIRNEAVCALGETGRTGLQILHIFRSWFYEPSSCISSYLKKYQNSSWWWLLPMTSRNLLQKNICLTARILLSPKSHIYWLYPYFFEAVSQSYLRYCLLGYSPHCAPNKT